MSQVSPELEAMAHAAYGALNAGDLDSFLAMVAEDVEFTSMVAEAEGTTFRGHTGVRAWWEALQRAFEDLSWEVLELWGSGDAGVINFRIKGTHAGLKVGQTQWQAVKLREGKIAWWAPFRSEDAALKAAPVGVTLHAQAAPRSRGCVDTAPRRERTEEPPPAGRLARSLVAALGRCEPSASGSVSLWTGSCRLDPSGRVKRSGSD